MNPQRKLQIFVSSTFTDLRNERQAAVEAILGARHIPAGMELFAAGDQEQMQVIRRWIDDSDIFMLILGGRYGSVEPTSGKSYVQLEYEYAIQQRKPFFAIVMTEESRNLRLAGGEIAADINEQEHPELLSAFRETVTGKMCAMADDLKDIAIQVQRSIVDLLDRHEMSGWISAKEVPDSGRILADVAASMKHAADLELKNVALEQALEDAKSSIVDPNARSFAGRSFEELTSALGAKTVRAPAYPHVDSVLAGLRHYSGELALGVSKFAEREEEGWLFKRIAAPLLIFRLVELEPGYDGELDKLTLTADGLDFAAELQVRNTELSKKKSP